MEPFFVAYMGTWILACAVAIATFARNRSEYSFTRPEYRRFLFVPWKLTTFAVATLGITVIAPYTGDPTWDYFDALFMAVFTFLGAPWAVGAMYLVIRKKLRAAQFFVALCLMMFSASWSYDLYLVLRDGSYPETWFANIFASGVLYVSAGLMWNLDVRPGRGVIFSFMEPDWPGVAPSKSFAKLFWYAFPFMLIVTIAILSFVVPNPFA